MDWLAKEKDLTEPELEHAEDSEIVAVIDLGAVGMDGINRPIFINQCDEETLALTMEDAQRLHKFLGEALEYLKTYKERITQ